MGEGRTASFFLPADEKTDPEGQKKDKESQKKKEFIEAYLKAEIEKPDKIEFMIGLYQDRWGVDDMQKISGCGHINEMKQMKESLERVRCYQTMLNG